VNGCIVSDEVVHATLNAQQARLLFVNVMQLTTETNSLLDDMPYLVVNQVEVVAVWWPQIWSSVKAAAFSRSRTVSHAQCAGVLSTFRPVYIKLRVILQIFNRKHKLK